MKELQILKSKKLNNFKSYLCISIIITFISCNQNELTLEKHYNGSVKKSYKLLGNDSVTSEFNLSSHLSSTKTYTDSLLRYEVVYYDNDFNSVKEMINYLNDSISEHKVFFENGNLHMIGKMKDGVKIGKWAYYQESKHELIDSIIVLDSISISNRVQKNR